MCNKEEEEKMKNTEVVPEQGYKKLSLSSESLKENTVSPKIKDGKVMLDKNNPKHRYLYEE